MGPPADIDQLAHRFIDAFNARDAEGLVALCDPAIDFQPTPLVGSSRVYRGHVGLREWVEELLASKATHQVRVREVRDCPPDGFLLLSEVLLGEEVVSPSAMRAFLGEDGLIVEARAYLSSEDTLRDLGILPTPE